MSNSGTTGRIPLWFVGTVAGLLCVYFNMLKIIIKINLQLNPFYVIIKI